MGFPFSLVLAIIGLITKYHYFLLISLMDALERLLQSIDSRILEIDFSKLYNWSYLTESRPESFAFAGWLTLLVMLDLLVVGCLFILLRKRVLVLMGKRKIIIKRVVKYNFIFSLVWLLFIFFRFQGVAYLSMRLWQLLFLLIMLLGNLFAAVMFFRAEKVTTTEPAPNKGANYYQDYLPKKSKKRKH